MDPATISAALTSLGYGAYVPVVLAVIGLFSAIATIYPPSAPGAALVHKVALLIGRAAPAATTAPAARTSSAIKVMPLVLLATLALGACSNAGAAPTTGNAVVQDGHLFCSVITATTPAAVAASDALTGKPITVIGTAAAVVGAICAAIDGIPVVPPANPAIAPLMPVVIVAG